MFTRPTDEEEAYATYNMFTTAIAKAEIVLSDEGFDRLKDWMSQSDEYSDSLNELIEMIEKYRNA